MSPHFHLRDVVGNLLGSISRLVHALGLIRLSNVIYGEGLRIRVHDQLTGLLSRPEFRRRAEARWHELQGSCVLLFDVDRLFYLNETLGHVASDERLVAIAKLVVDSAERCVVGRWGGDEFAVFATDAVMAERIAGRVRSAMERSFADERAAVVAMHPKLFGLPLLTFSVGAATIGVGESLTEVLDRCDAALWSAKEAGRNRLCWDQKGR